MTRRLLRYVGYCNTCSKAVTGDNRRELINWKVDHLNANLGHDVEVVRQA